MELLTNPQKLAAYREQAAALTAQMTLEEKVSQTLYNAPAIPRLGIPAYNWWNEALHGIARAGTATVFPQAIAMAAAFDEEMMEKVGEAVSTEARAKYNAQCAAGDRDIYKGLTCWAPNVNIFRDPRWGRGHETYGEDPYLTSRLAVRFIQGMQGHDPDHLRTAACAKHFAVHSGPEAVRHSFNAEVSAKDMAETYLPPFRACVQEAKVEIVMGAYNRLNGVPCCGNPELLENLLRGEWAFDGHVTSDFYAIKDFHEGHGVTADEEDSAALAMNSGCDLDAGRFYKHLVDAVHRGKVSQQRLDEAVTNLLATRIRLGILGEHAENFDEIPYTVVDSPEMVALNRAVSLQCPVLLKNDGILPLDPAKKQTLAVIGPNANSRAALVGNYEGTASRYVTVLEGIQDAVGPDTRVLYAQGCHLYKDRTSGLAQADDRISETKAVCAAADVIVAVVGLDATIEGEEGDAGNEYGSGDKPNLHLPGLQQHLLETAASFGKPLIVITLAGSALALDWAEEHAAAVVHGSYPGALGGWALAQLIFGFSDFSGRLPVTFYSAQNHLPSFEDYAMQGRTYRFMQEKPLYPFGYGLGYTSFSCRELAADRAVLHPGEDLTLSVTLQNTGRRTGSTVVQVYVRAPGGTPNAQLKKIRRATLCADEAQRLTLHLPPEAFDWFAVDGTPQRTAGLYTIYVGLSQPDERSAELLQQHPCALCLEMFLP